MKKTRDISLLSLTLMILLLMFVSHAQAALESGVPLQTWLNGKTFANIEIVVPEDATKLTVAITDGSGDLDLYLKYGSAVSGSTVSEIDADADIRSDGPTADESISLTPSTSPALQAGIWHIATLNLNDETTTFTLTATIETAKTLPLPTSETVFPTYPANVFAEASIVPAQSKPIGVGNVAIGGETLAIDIELEAPSGPYDAYLAIQSPVVDPNDFFMLGQDGIFYSFSDNGFVKWKESASGRIDEKPFGEFPVSHLLGGIYNVYFLLTAAGSLDTYYLWSSYFNAPESVPDGSAGFFNGTLVVPNATIIHQGQEFQGSAPIPPDSLVGIVRDGKTYLYHTDLGKLVVSDEMTRQAVGRFVMGPTAQVKQKLTRTVLAPNSDNLLKISTTERLMTGVELQRQADKAVKIINKQRRWVAVKATDGSGPYFIPPVSRTVDNNIFRMFGTYWQWDSSWFNASLNHEYNFYPTSDTLVIETYGAVWRPIAHYLDYGSYIGDKVYYYFTGQPEPPIADPIPVDGLDLRNQQDAALSLALDRIDLAYMLLEGLKSFYAAKDVTEGAEIFVNAAANLALSITHMWYSGDAGSPNALSSLRSAVEDFISDLANIGIQLGTTAQATPILTLIDAIAAFDYVIEGIIIHEAEVLGNWAYDEIRMEPIDDSESCVIGTWQITDDINCNGTIESGETWGETWGLIELRYIKQTQKYIADNLLDLQGNWTLLNSDLGIVFGEASSLIRYSGTIDKECKNVVGKKYDYLDKSTGCFYGKLLPK